MNEEFQRVQKLARSLSNVTLELDDDGMFICVDGLKIAQRDDGRWVAVAPGWQVVGGEGDGQMPRKIIGEIRGDD